MSFLFISLLFLSSVANAGSAVGRTANGRLILTEDCNKIQADVNSIIQWTKKLEKRSCPPGNISISAAGKCVVDITDCVPGHVKKYHGLTSANNGPNCWNLALVMGGMVPLLRESSPEEWDFYLSSPLCRELAKNEQPLPGDIGSIEARGLSRKGHVHGFMFVSSTLVYSKNGTSLKSPYSLQSMDDMQKVYAVGGLNGECESDCGPQDLQDFISQENAADYPHGVPGSEVCYLNVSLDPVLKEGCKKLRNYILEKKENCKVCKPSSVHYYRCQTFEEFYSKYHLERKSELGKIDKLISKSEKCILPVLFSGIDSSSLQHQIADQLKILNVYLGQRPSWSSLGKEEKFVLASFALRLEELENSLANQDKSNELAQLFGRAIEELK